MGKYVPFIIPILIILTALVVAPKIRKEEPKLFYLTFIAPQVVVLLGYLKVFHYTYMR